MFFADPFCKMQPSISQNAILFNHKKQIYSTQKHDVLELLQKK